MNRIKLILGAALIIFMRSAASDQNISDVHAHAISNISLEFTGVDLTANVGDGTLRFTIPSASGVGRNVTFIDGYRPEVVGMLCPYVVYSVQWERTLKGNLNNPSRTSLIAKAVSDVDAYTSQVISHSSSTSVCREPVMEWGTSDGGDYGFSSKNYIITNSVELPVGRYNYTLTGKAIMAAGFANGNVANSFASTIAARFPTYINMVSSGNISISGLITAENYCNVIGAAGEIDHGVLPANNVDGHKATYHFNLRCNGATTAKFYSPNVDDTGMMVLGNSVSSKFFIKLDGDGGNEFLLSNGRITAGSREISRGDNFITVTSTLRGVPVQEGVLLKGIALYIDYL